MDNTEEIAQIIFTKPPGAVNSNNLSLEDETSYIAEQTGVEPFILNILRLITLHGIKILYGHTNILMLTKEQVDLIKEYTRSYGYNIKIELLIGFERI